MSAKPSIDSIFCSAIEVESPDERRALVEQACGEDLDLKQQVERLLHAHFHGRSILDDVVQPVATVDEPLQETTGTVIGQYKLLEQIGEGGMGTVWMAQQQEPVKRVVALKLTKAGMDSKQVIARFEAERQALALMDHANIARILDAGTSSTGRPYFVMDLVKGVPITKYCDEHHLTPRQRLELFIPVCQAVQHAHQKGIIHRDLKPSNVLVALYDGKPVPKVIDFGVAKAAGQSLTDKTLVTGFGAIVGTLEYMSPEQAEINQLDIDMRSDIYSLGVLLYELLAGSPPFSRKELEKAGMLEMLRVIREQEPSKPSTKLSTADGLPTLAANRGTEPAKLTKLVRGELDWIAMKCLEKDRNRRYESANGLAMDVQRYLADEAVQACPPSAWYRFRKFARRNEAKLAAAGLVLFFLVILGVGVVWYQQEQAARAVALAARRVETERAVTAALAQALTLLDEGDKQIEEPERWRATMQQAVLTLEKAEELLAAGEGTEELVGRVRQVRSAVDVNVKLSQLFVDLNQVRLEDAANSKDGVLDRERSAQMRATVFSAYGLDLAKPDVAVAMVQSKRLRVMLFEALEDWWVVADVKGRQRLEAVLQAVEPSDAFRRQLWMAVRRGNKSAMVELSKEAPLHELPPTTVCNLAGMLMGQNETAAAERILRAALEDRPGDLWLNWLLGFVLTNQGPKRAQEAIGYLRVAVALRNDNPRLRNYLSASLSLSGDLEGAIREARAGIRIWPDDRLAHIELAGSLYLHGEFEEAVREYQSLVQADPKEPILRKGLGHALSAKKDFEGAIREFRACLQIEPALSEARSGLIAALRDKGDLEGAIQEARTAIRIKPNDRAAHTELAYSLFLHGDLEEAIKEYQALVQADPKSAPLLYALGNALSAKKDFEGALRAYRAALQILPKFDDARHALGKALEVLSWRLVTSPDPKSRDPRRAVELAKELVQLFPKQGDNWKTLGTVYFSAGDWKSAIEAVQESMKLRKGADSRDFLLLARAHQRLGQTKEASQWRTKLGEMESPVALRRCEGHIGDTFCVAFSSNGRRALSGGKDNTVRLWDVETGKELRVFIGHEDMVLALAFSADGRSALSGSGDGTVRLWDVENGRQIHRLQAPEKEHIQSVAFSPDGRRALTGSLIFINRPGLFGAIRLWNLENGKEMRCFAERRIQVYDVAFSPDGRRVLSGGSDGLVRLWDAETGKELGQFRGHTGFVTGVTFSPDGRRALSGSFDGTARVWDVDSGKELQRFERIPNKWGRVAFSQDGGRALSGDGEKVRLWDVETGKEIACFSVRGVELLKVVFSPDGRRALSSGSDGLVRLWQLPKAAPGGKETLAPKE